jgi:hypothetical protein
VRDSRLRSPIRARYGIVQDLNRKGFLTDDPKPGRRCLRMELHKDINHGLMPPPVYSTRCPRKWYNRLDVTKGDCVGAARAILVAKYPGSVLGNALCLGRNSDAFIPNAHGVRQEAA